MVSFPRLRKGRCGLGRLTQRCTWLPRRRRKSEGAEVADPAPASFRTVTPSVPLAAAGPTLSKTGGVDDPVLIHGAEPAPAKGARPARRSEAEAAEARSKAPRKRRRGGAPSGLLALLALGAGGAYGVASWNGGAGEDSALFSAAVIFGVVLSGLHLSWYLLAEAFRLLRWAVPIAIVLLLGDAMGWQWAEGVNSVILTAGGSLLDGARGVWNTVIAS